MARMHRDTSCDLCFFCLATPKRSEMRQATMVRTDDRAGVYSRVTVGEDVYRIIYAGMNDLQAAGMIVGVADGRRRALDRGHGS